VAQVLEEMQYNDLLQQVCRKTKNVLIAGNPKGRQRPEYYLELAWLSQRLGEVSDAIDFYERALDLNYANVYPPSQKATGVNPWMNAIIPPHRRGIGGAIQIKVWG